MVLRSLKAPIELRCADRAVLQKRTISVVHMIVNIEVRE